MLACFVGRPLLDNNCTRVTNEFVSMQLTILISTVKENIVRKPARLRHDKKNEICEIRLSALARLCPHILCVDEACVQKWNI